MKNARKRLPADYELLAARGCANGTGRRHFRKLVHVNVPHEEIKAAEEIGAKESLRRTLPRNQNRSSKRCGTNFGPGERQTLAPTKTMRMRRKATCLSSKAKK